MHCLSIMLIIMLIGTTFFIMQPIGNVKAAPSEDDNYDEIYYVSANGNDANDGLSEDYPFATLAKTANVINNGIDGNYLVIVMTDLTSTACARYYDNTVTIKSLGDTSFTVTRGVGFSIQRENRRAWYNPAMIEIGGDVTPTGPKISLTLKNIIFDDAYLYEGTTFRYAGTAPNPDPTNVNLVYVQDAIVASYSPNSVIILAEGAELHNFGGMTALRATDGATAIMKDGSLITDVGSTASTRQVSSTSTDYRANGEAAVSISTNAHFYMYDGSKITNIANAHSVKLSGVYRCFIDGEIAYMKGSKGMDATDGNQAANHEGRGFKNAVLFNGGTTLNPETGAPGAAIIGPNAYIHNNGVKCGAVGINRSANVFVEIYGKINNNVGLTGSRYVLGIPIAAGTNGGGLYIVGGGTIRLEAGSEVCNNVVSNSAYGGAASIQQNGARLIMNGGLVSGNTASAANTHGVVVSKGDASFEMNGGIIDNGNHGLRLYESGSDGTVGKLVLNAGIVSGVTVDSAVPFGYTLQRHLFINDAKVTIGTGYASIAGKNVYPIVADFKIGNPNTAIYSTIRSSLPQGWTMPSTDVNVIGFWVQKNGRVEYSVAKPTTGMGGANYVSSLNVYFAAVQATTATGAIDSSIPLKIYPTSIVKIGTVDSIVVSVPLNVYPNGATVALVQPTTAYDKIIFDGPETLTYNLNANIYSISYTASYNMPQGLHAELTTDGHTNTNTFFSFTIRPDPRTIPDISSITIDSDIFKIDDGSPIWVSGTGEFVVTLKLTDDWANTKNLMSTFEFSCTMDAADFEEGELLRLTGDLAIVGNGKNYLVYGNEVKTVMIVPKGSLKVSKVLLGDAVDETAEFHFKVTFSNGGTYDGVTSGSVIPLKGGENHVITNIPQGVTYTVVEVEANQYGYTTTSTGANGIIMYSEQSEANFVNIKNNPIDVTEYTVTYHGNGHTAGLVPIDNNSPYESGSQVTIKGSGSMVKTGYFFLGWSLNPKANTATYTADSVFYITSDTLLYAIWSANSYTITYTPGTHGTFNTQTTTQLHYGDPTPNAPATTGETGWIFTEWTPTPTTTVTTNVTYVAQWKQEQTTTITPTPSPSTPTATLAPSTSPSLTPTQTTTTPFTSPHVATPTTSPSGGIENAPAWALVNLVLSVVGLILSIALLIVCVLLPSMKKQKAQKDSEKQQKQHRNLWLLIVLAMGITGVIVFLLTENIKLPMGLVDKWTIINAVIFIVELITIAFIFKRKENHEKQKKTTTKSNKLS